MCFVYEVVRTTVVVLEPLIFYPAMHSLSSQFPQLPGTLLSPPRFNWLFSFLAVVYQLHFHSSVSPHIWQQQALQLWISFSRLSWIFLALCISIWLLEAGCQYHAEHAETFVCTALNLYSSLQSIDIPGDVGPSRLWAPFYRLCCLSPHADHRTEPDVALALEGLTSLETNTNTKHIARW